MSRQWRAASAAALQEFCERPLGEVDLMVLMLDGIRLGDVVLVVGLGLDAQGHKHLLGLWQRDTENARAWQYFRASGEIDGINAGAKRMVPLGNSHSSGLPGFIATPERHSAGARMLGVDAGRGCWARMLGADLTPPRPPHNISPIRAALHFQRRAGQAR